MSLRIDVDRVSRVLLADGWHDVADASFSLDAYEYLWSGREGASVDEVDEPMVLHGGGQSGISATGFAFIDAASRQRIYGPLSAILAVSEPEKAGEG